MQQVNNKKVEAAPGSELFNRPPRIWTSLPMVKVNIPPLPSKDPLPTTAGALTMVMPVMMMGMLVGVSILVSHVSLQALAFLLPMAMFSVMTPFANLLTARRESRPHDASGKRPIKNITRYLQSCELT